MGVLMYLESIELFGFKTFVSNTKILFSPRITCIVGPNGAGKSNIVDAVRWMLGEQRLTLLRASDSTDLIFSGSSIKKQLSVASVKMVFNNESRTFAVKTPRLIIEKRIYRNREIHYYINGEESTMQKINSIFHSANIFSHTYAIVGQGKIDEILLARPEEKKAFINKIAGIDVYRRKKDEAVKKLIEVEENLTRVSDRLGELRQHANHVLSEAKKAHMYYILSDRLKEEETILLNAEMKVLQDSIKVVSSGLGELERESEEITDSILEKKKGFDFIEEGIDSLNELKEKILQDKEKLVIEKTKLLGSEARLREKIEDMENKISENGLQIEKMEKTLNSLDKDVKSLSIKKSEFELDLNAKENELKEFSQKIESLEKVLAPLYEEDKIRNEKIRLIGEERVKFEKLLSVKETELKFLESQMAELDKFVESFDNQEAYNESQFQEELDSLYKKKQELSVTLGTLGEKFALLKYRSSELKKFILTHNPGDWKFPEKSLGSFLKLTKTFPGLEEELSAIILNSAEDLSHYKEGMFFLDLKDIDFKVTKNEKISAVEEILGVSSKFLSGIYYSFDLRSALDFFNMYSEKIFIKKIITADGFIVTSPFEVKMSTDIAAAHKNEELKLINKELGETSELRLKLNDEILENENLIKSLEAKFNKVREHNEKMNSLEMNKKELASLKKRSTELENEKTLIRQKISEFLKVLGELNEDIEVKSKKAELDALKSEFLNKSTEVRETEFKIERISNEIEEKRKIIENIVIDVKELKSEQEENYKALEEFKYNLNETLNFYKKIETTISEVEGKEKELKAKLREKLEEEKTIEVEISKIEERNREILKRMEKQRISIAQKETEINGIRNILIERGVKEREISYHVDTEALKKEIKELKEEINELGAIDFTSVSEEEQISKELEEKESVYNDVKSSKKELEKFIEEMENKIKIEFDKTLSKIEDNFSKFFARMFKGGEAFFEKILDESGEIKGIEINLRPPGKKKQTLQLLSGGEKTLAAIALLFSIFKVKPSPFYILDEVDAALDEENIVRFGELLEEESNNAQFIIITHNKETMQKTDVFYGITMEEDGISKVVSLKLV